MALYMLSALKCATAMRTDAHRATAVCSPPTLAWRLLRACTKHVVGDCLHLIELRVGEKREEDGVGAIWGLSWSDSNGVNRR